MRYHKHMAYSTTDVQSTYLKQVHFSAMCNNVAKSCDVVFMLEVTHDLKWINMMESLFNIIHSNNYNNILSNAIPFHVTISCIYSL